MIQNKVVFYKTGFCAISFVLSLLTGLIVLSGSFPEIFLGRYAISAQCPFAAIQNEATILDTWGT